ncbi:MAG: RNA pyrophosphohydrolase [Alphaproteobacteria bacterium]
MAEELGQRTAHEDEAVYRRGVGIMLVNREGLVLVAERIGAPGTWQMPQGGIDAGETPAHAAMRELKEEIGTDKAEILAESRGWLAYDVPQPLRERVWGGRYRGQRQKWFLCRFLGADADVDLEHHHHPEFSSWRWSEPALLPGLVVPFKRALYQAVLAEFSAHLPPLADKG